MRYIIAFGKFWRDFIIGDDWTIAVTIMWGLAFVYELSKFGINAWYALPIIAAFKIWLEARSYLTPKRKPSALSINYLWLPMFSVAVLPLIIFRIKNGDFSLTHLALPVLFSTITVAIVAAILIKPYRKYPVAASVIALIVSVAVIVNRLQPYFQRLAENTIYDSALHRFIIYAATFMATTAIIIIFIKPGIVKNIKNNR